MADKIRITLKIAGREYPLTIDREDEEKYRRAAKDINELVVLFSRSYELDSESYMAMAALQMALRSISSKEESDFGPLLEELKMLDAELEATPGGEILDKRKR